MHKRQIDLDRIFVIEDFYSAEECAEAIKRSEVEGYHEATITVAGGAVMDKGTRNNARLIVDDPLLAKSLWNRLQPLVPPRYDDWIAVGLNERFRYYRYDVGQQFKLHIDGAFYRDNREHSRLTFMIYLNDDFDGGETRFYVSTGDLRASVKPQRGMALVFVHQQLHEGAPVWEGRKYVLRSDVMYRLTG